MILCDILGLIEGPTDGTGLGFAFLQHVQPCKILLHVIDISFKNNMYYLSINQEFKKCDNFLAQKTQVVVLNKLDIPEIQEKEEELKLAHKREAGHISFHISYHMGECQGTHVSIEKNVTVEAFVSL